MKQTILVAGASGFIGRALIENLKKDPEITIIALSRKERKQTDPQVIWKACDLYSLKDLTSAMQGCDAAYYLVHSMLPSAGLSQGEFYDFDLIMADNFVRATNLHKVKRIVYLGGLVPKNEQELSWHLKSRLEVEKTLRHSQAEVIALRAGLIIGSEGSSFFILRKLVSRLPAMIFPSWTSSRMQPIALPDVVRILTRSLTMKYEGDASFDIGGPESLSYRDLILKTAELYGKTIPFLRWNFISIRLSRFWVSLVTGSPKSLVYPLVLSLKYDMLIRADHAWPYPEDIRISIDDAIEQALREAKDDGPKTFVPSEKDVRSVQRLSFPAKKNAEWVTDEYFRWLPHALRPLIKVERSENRLVFKVFYLPFAFLILEKNVERSTPDRQLLYIKGGVLSKYDSAKPGRGRLEFREVLDQKYIMAAIHEFRPALPWILYRYTQARVHLMVMNAFERHLKKIGV